ncbi:hypothetical protein FD02_GL000740 [Lacticaseibacillus nasuensis JCM 17158]|uniref:DUF4352 domain-containing protein n=1 Tax=Lacticaseibacillus nasuensis JCM 17158 TaxID=1291734 RepID=A0A0R1K0F2_9LACO|nr:hypothetical protein FD02_GL000740 [Lacticaseibacillus nasuensis JCM 17158]
MGTAKKQIENGAILSKDVLHKLKYKSGKFDDSEGEGTTNDDESDSSDDSSEDTTSSTPYEIGQEAKLSDGSGNQMWGLKLTSATKNFNSSGQNLVNSDIDTIAITNEKSVQFSFNYTNYGDSESYLPTIWDFTVYDQSGTAGEIVDQQDGQNEVSIGHNGNTTFWVNFTSAVGKGDKVTLEYQPDGLDSPITFEATVN